MDRIKIIRKHNNFKLILVVILFTVVGCSKYSPVAPQVFPDSFPTSAPITQIVPDSPPLVADQDPPAEPAKTTVPVNDSEANPELPDVPEIISPDDLNEIGSDIPDDISDPVEVQAPENDLLSELNLKYSYAGEFSTAPALSDLAQKVLEQVNNDEVTSEANSPVKRQFLATTGNRFIKPLVDGVEIFNAFKDTIASAKYEVDLVSFEWNDKSDAARLIGEGIKLAEQNYTDKKIVVRLIIDDLFLDPRRIIDIMNESRKSWDIDESKIDLQFATYPHLAFGANHSKYLVVDGKNLIITGANVQVVHNFTEKIWHDTGYLFEGTAALTVMKDFDQAWTNRARHYTCHDRTIPIDCLKSDAPPTPDRSYLADVDYQNGIPLIVLPKKSQEHIHDKIDNPVAQAWLAAIDNARESVDIETPNINAVYFQDAVIRAVKRGVTVKIISNMNYNELLENLPFQGGSNEEIMATLINRIKKEDNTKTDYLKLAWYSKDGINPVTGKDNVSHTKYMSVDGVITIIGSGNMDTQSWEHSRELNILIDNQYDTQRIIDAFYNSDWNRSIKISDE
jgi:phosphatidylserine/phosphatidylglycerophosphate/cardiolipin synthase-like enzyme